MTVHNLADLFAEHADERTDPPPEPEDDDAAEFEQVRAARKLWHRADREARRELDEEEFSATAVPRRRRTAGEYATVRQPAPIMDSILPAAPALLGGPEGSGKSLQARDWGLHVASGMDWHGFRVHEPRAVLYVMDEGMHDFTERWAISELWHLACDRIYVVDEPLNLLSRTDVEAFVNEYADVRPGLTIFDTIYGMGMPDDTGVKEVAPVIDAMKRVSAAWNGCTLAIGHAGHDTSARRFRGSSMWRQRTDVDWHMADNKLTCERSKIANKSNLSWSYRLEYPAVRLLGLGEQLSKAALREEAVRTDFWVWPRSTQNERANRVAKVLRVSPSTAIRIIRDVRAQDQLAQANIDTNQDH